MDDEPGGNPGAPTAAPIRTVGRYEIVREIGRGGMAVVYLARQRDLDRLVALKELSSFHASAPEFAERFLRESRLAGSLSHPNIVTVHEYFEEGGVPYIAMEYVPRGSLRQWVGSLTLAQLAGVMEGMLAGLAHAEPLGIVHRDLKPENIMVTAEGRVKITDFGIAKATQSAGTAAFMTATGTTVGTPTYMAPEQAMAQQLGPWTDLYSVGVMAYEQVVGRPPFHDTEAPMAILLRHVNEQIPPLVEVRPDVDPALSAWVDRLLVKEPADRTRSAPQAWDELEEIVLGVLGARWRREARLPDRGPMTITPLPLTPAPFESQHVPTPPPAPAAAAPASEFLTFGSPSAAEPAAAATPPAAPASIPPAAATPPLAGVPEAGAASAAPVAPPTSPSPGSPAAPATPQEDEARFVTFGGAPEPPTATPPPAAAAPPAAAPPAAPPVEPPAPPTPPPATPEPPAHGTTWQPTVTPSEPQAPSSEPKIVSTEPAVAAVTAPAPAVGPAPATVSAAAVAREPRAEPSARSAGNRRLLVAIVTALVIAAGVGFAVAHSSGGSTASALSGHAAAGPLEVSFPSSWQQQGSVPTTPGISLNGSLALAASSSGGELVIGSATPNGATLLPASLLSALPSAPHGEAVRLGELELYRYRNLQPTGAAVPETVYALGTSSGTVLGVCVPPASGAVAFTAQCEQVLGSLKLTSGSATALGLNQAYATALGSALSALNSARVSAGATLAKAGSASAQATAAATLAQAHAHAAAAVRAANPGPAEQAANAALAAALSRIAGGYSALASAARSGNTGGYDAARQTVDGGTAALTKAVGELRKLGYE
jgi:predicted Ser/Thr protein kinase